jgi:hypothetical protein
VCASASCVFVLLEEEEEEEEEDLKKLKRIIRIPSID